MLYDFTLTIVFISWHHYVYDFTLIVLDEIKENIDELQIKDTLFSYIFKTILDVHIHSDDVHEYMDKNYFKYLQK